MTSIKTQELFIQGFHEYNLITEGETVKLYYSTAEHWTNPEEMCLGLENTGDNYKLLRPLRKKNQIDYDEAEMIYILLAAVKESKVEVVESKKLL